MMMFPMKTELLSSAVVPFREWRRFFFCLFLSGDADLRRPTAQAVGGGVKIHKVLENCSSICYILYMLK